MSAASWTRGSATSEASRRGRRGRRALAWPATLFLILAVAGCAGGRPPLDGFAPPGKFVQTNISVDAESIRVVPPFERVWGEKVGGRVIEGMTVSRDRVFAASFNRRLSAFDTETGKPVWREKLPEPPLGGPEVGGGRVWVAVGPHDSRLLSLGYVTGTRLGDWPIPPAVGGPVIRDGMIIVGSLGGLIQAARWDELTTAGPSDEFPAVWKTRLKGGLRTRPVAVSDSVLLVGTLADSLCALDVQSGERRWQIGLSGAVYGITPHGDRVVVTLYDGTVLELLPEDGGIVWSQKVEGPLLAPAAVGEDLVAAVSTGGVITALGRDGTVRWTASLQQAVESRPVLTSEYLIVGTRRGALVGIRRNKGTRDWSLDFEGPLTVPPCIDEERLLLADGSGHIRSFSHAGRQNPDHLANGASDEPTVASHATAAVDSAWISVRSEPAGLGVLIDGAFAGWTPLDSVFVPPGLHHVTVRDTNGLFTGRVARDEWVRVERGRHEEVSLTTKRILRVESRPPGATVSTEREYLGTAPVDVTRAVGVVRLRHPGFRDTVLAVEDITSSWVVVRMVPDGPSLVPHTAVSPPEGGKPWYMRGVVRWGAPALSLASGVAAVLFRNEANDAFDRYLTTGEPVARDRHLDRAERLDRQSLVSWVAAEVFFAVSFYSWIRNDEEKERSSDLPGPVASRGVSP